MAIFAIYDRSRIRETVVAQKIMSSRQSDTSSPFTAFSSLGNEHGISHCEKRKQESRKTKAGRTVFPLLSTSCVLFKQSLFSFESLIFHPEKKYNRIFHLKACLGGPIFK